MSGFRARNLRFCTVREIGLLDERIIWFFKVKHLFAVLPAIFVVMVDGSPVFSLIAAGIAAFATISALYPQRAVGFEALLYGAIRYILTSKREKVTVTLPNEKDARVIGETSTPSVAEIEWFDDESDVAGLNTRDVIMKKKYRVKKIM